LKALRDGDVRVTATALDGSGESASLDIAISNQGAIAPVTGITVTAAGAGGGGGAGGVAEVAAKSRLARMSAAVEPSGATAKNVIWSVSNKTGLQEPALARIGADGVLRPLYDGVVTVRATAADGSGVYGELDVEISGQNPGIVPVASISIELLSGSRALSAAANTATVRANAWPSGATSGVALSIGATENFGQASPNASISVDPETGVATVTALRNGTFAVVADATNGWGGSPVRTVMQFASVGFEEPTGIVSPYELVKARTYASGRTNDSDGANNLALVGPTDDRLVNNTGNRSWVLYRNVDFGPWGSDSLILYGVNANAGGNAAEAEIHLGSRSGPLLGTIRFEKNASAWGYNYTAQTFVPADASALRNLTGVQDLCFMFTSGSMYFYGWQFTENPKTDRDPYAINPAAGADYRADGIVGYHGFAFGGDGSRKVVITGSTQNAPAKVEIRDAAADGAVLASVDFPDTSGETLGKVFNLYGAAIKRARHLYFAYPAGVFELESVQFLEARPEPASAYQAIQSEDFDSSDDGYAIRNYAGGDGNVGAAVHVTDPNNVSFIYKGLDFGPDAKNMVLRIYGKGDGTRDVRVSTSPESSATIKIGAPDSAGYALWEYPIGGETGVRDIDFYFMPGTDVWIDWFEFVELPDGPLAAKFTLPDGSAAETLADAAGKELGVEVLANAALLPPGKAVSAIVAVYDGAGRLAALKTGGGGMYYFSIPADAAGMAVKVMLWDEAYIPVASAVTLD
jgi:hypothetical protein